MPTTVTTVNVIEIPDTDHNGGIFLSAFPDTPEGNQEAEALFTKLFDANTYFDEEEKCSIEQALEDGYFEADKYYIAIVHSVPRT
jgi:hypothetical protein